MPSGASVQETPQLAAAAEKSLVARGGTGGPGWTRAWDACLFARLHRGSEALAHLQRLLATRSHPNLLGKGGQEFQIDRNFGASAAIAEMLLQSHGFNAVREF